MGQYRVTLGAVIVEGGAKHRAGETVEMTADRAKEHGVAVEEVLPEPIKADDDCPTGNASEIAAFDSPPQDRMIHREQSKRRGKGGTR